MKIKNIIFDMGNVLLDFNPDFSLDTLCESEEAKRTIKKEYFEGPEWIQSDLGLISAEERVSLVKKRVSEKYHKDLTTVAKGWDICMVPVKGAKEFCGYIKENGYKAYVLSNASEEFYSYFPKHYDMSFFDGIVVSADLHIIKPDAAIYRYITEKYRLVPGECLFIDDRKENVEAAKTNGMNAVLFSGSYEAVKNILESI